MLLSLYVCRHRWQIQRWSQKGYQLPPVWIFWYRCISSQPQQPWVRRGTKRKKKWTLQTKRTRRTSFVSACLRLRSVWRAGKFYATILTGEVGFDFNVLNSKRTYGWEGTNYYVCSEGEFGRMQHVPCASLLNWCAKASCHVLYKFFKLFLILYMSVHICMCMSPVIKHTKASEQNHKQAFTRRVCVCACFMCDISYHLDENLRSLPLVHWYEPGFKSCLRRINGSITGADTRLRTCIASLNKRLIPWLLFCTTCTFAY